MEKKRLYITVKEKEELKALMKQYESEKLTAHFQRLQETRQRRTVERRVKH